MTDPTPDSLHLSWTVPEGQFDSFVVQYKDREGQPQVMPVEGPERSVIVSSLDPNHKYRFTLFGIADKKRHGPLTADGTTGEWQPPEPPREPSQPSTHLPSARSQVGPPTVMANSKSWPRSQAESQPPPSCWVPSIPFSCSLRPIRCVIPWLCQTSQEFSTPN